MSTAPMIDNDNDRHIDRWEAIKTGLPLSKTGAVKHGEEIFVPWGNTDQWNLIITVYHVGRTEPGGQVDNALMEFTVKHRELGDKSGWVVSSDSAFRFWNKSKFANIPVKLRYLVAVR